MLFGDIDWNQVLIKGLIGGVVGLVLYLFRKGSGPGKGDQ